MNPVTVEDVYEELKRIEKTMVTKEQMQQLLETVEIASNPDTVRQLRESKEDIKHGRIKSVSSVRDLLQEA